MNLLWTLIFCIISMSCFSQELSLDFDVSTLFHHEQRSFHCNRYQKLLKYYEANPEINIEEQLNIEISAAKLLLSEKMSFKERRLLKKNQRIIKKILRYKNKKEGIRKFTKSLCKGAEAVTYATAWGLSWTANLIMTTVETPFRATGKFARGVISGKVRENYGEIYYDILGPSLYGSYSSSLLMSRRLLSLSTVNPWLIPMLAAPAIDNQVLRICKRKNSLNKREQQFCQNYLKFKKGMLKVTHPFEKWGANLHKKLNKKGNQEQQEEKKPLTQSEMIEYLKDLNDDNYCERMVALGEKYQEVKKATKAKANQEIWRQGTNPERYGVPEILDFVSSEEMIIAPARKQLLRNVIISFAPAKSETRGLNLKQEIREYKKLYKKFKRYGKKARKVFLKSKTIEQCEQLKDKYSFDYKSFKQISDSLDEKVIAKKLYENKQIKKQFNLKTSLLNFPRSVKLEWDFIESGDIQTIHQILTSKNVGNVILLVHGTKKGKLIDSHYNELPRNFFKDLSPSIQSLNFFSCYSQYIDSYYNIVETFEKMKSYHKRRHISFVERDLSYSYESGQVPFSAFTGYFSDLDFFLQKTTQGNLLSSSLKAYPIEEQDPFSCEIQLHHIGQQEVNFGLFVNNHFVGALQRGEVKNRFEFPCRFIENQKNKIRLVDLDLRDDESLDLSSFKAYVITPTEMININTNKIRIIQSRENRNIRAIIGSF